MAFDDFGVIKQKFYSSWLPRTQDDYDFLSNTSCKYILNVIATETDLMHISVLGEEGAVTPVLDI